VQNNTTEWMRTIPQRRSFKLQFPQSRKTFFLPRFGSVMCWFSWLLTLNAIEWGGLSQKRKVRWMGWCHHCGQLNGHRKNWRRWKRERAQNKIIRQTGKKEELGINKKKFEIELFRIIYSGETGATGRMGIVLAIQILHFGPNWPDRCEMA